MQRRDFITLIGGAAAAWPVAARGQPAGSARRVGWLVGLGESDPEARRRTAAFVQQLEHLGWTIGRNIQIDYRWLSDSLDRNETYVEELAALKPDVLVTSSTPAVKAFRQLTRTIPIVFAIVTDPVSSGLVTSLTSPGGNATGFTNFEFTMGGKWLEVLKQAAPGLAKVALIYNPKTTPYAGYLKSIEASATSLGVELIARGVADTTEIKQVIEVTGAASHGWPHRVSGLFHCSQSPIHYRVGSPGSRASDLSVSIFCRRRRLDVIWRKHCRGVSASGDIRRPHPAGRQPR